MHRQGGGQRLNVQLASKTLGLELRDQREQYPLDVRVARLEAVQHLDAGRVQAHLFGHSPKEILPKHHADVLGGAAQHLFRALAGRQDLDAAALLCSLPSPVVAAGHEVRRGADVQVDEMPGE